MSHFETFQVFPYTPKPLLFLETLSRNLWWSWNLDAIELFRRIDPRLWEESGHNPIVFSTMIRQERLEGLAHDVSFLAHMERVKRNFETQILKPSDLATSKYTKDDIVAYFSMEFGIHESLPFFAGGLGVLSGDHLKAASDLNLPMVAVGLLYRRGYFHQFLDPSGWQQEEYPESDLYHLPVRRAKDPTGKELTITVQGPNGPFKAIVWVLMVGRIPLYLLDTNMPENTAEIREITARLYVGDEKLRLAQEILLGIGGMQLYKAETPGPSKDSKLTPRITETAKALWFIYLTLTVICGLAYWAAGMQPFDALGHAFSTVAIGGFSTHDASIGYFQSPTINLIAIVALSGTVVKLTKDYFAQRAKGLEPVWTRVRRSIRRFLTSELAGIEILDRRHPEPAVFA